MDEIRKIILRKERKLSMVLSVGFKLVIKMFSLIWGQMFKFIFPLVVMITAISVFYYFREGNSVNIISAIQEYKIGGFVMVGYLIMYFLIGVSDLFVYSAVQEYDLHGINTDNDSLSNRVKENAGTYLVGLSAIAAVFIVAFLGISAFNSISIELFTLVYFLFAIGGILLYNIVQYVPLIMLEEKLPLRPSIKRSFYLVRNNWWSVFAVNLVGLGLGMVIIYNLFYVFITIGSLILSMFFPDLVEKEAYLLVTFGLGTFLGLVTISCVFILIAGARHIKYFDLIERKEAPAIQAAIKNMGKTSSVFTNEGDF